MPRASSSAASSTSTIRAARGSAPVRCSARSPAPRPDAPRRTDGGVMGDLNKLSAADIAKSIAAEKFTAEAVVSDCLDRIAVRESAIHAWANIDPGYALMQARALDRMPSSKGLLHGVPIGVKDIINTEHLPTEMGSPLYKGNRSHGDAACVALARMAGAVILGKTVTAEFAGMFPGPTANPHNPEHT